MMHCIYTCLFILLTGLSFGQENLFEKYYPGVGTGVRYMIETSDKDIIMVGHNNILPLKMSVIAVDSLGNYKWHKWLGGDYENRAGGIIQTSDGHLTIIGGTVITDQNIPRVFLLTKLSTDGDLIWQKQFGEENYYTPLNMIEVEHGNLLIVGSNSDGTGNYSVVKTDSLGQILWEIWEITPEHDSYSEAALDKEGNYLVMGTWSEAFGKRQYLLTKLSPSGDTIWSNTYGTETVEFSEKMILDDQGDILIAGTINYQSTEKANTTFLKVSTDGDSLWHSFYPDDENLYSRPYAGIVKLEGDTLVIPTILERPDSTRSIHLSYFDLDGSLLQNKDLGFYTEDYLLRVFKRDKNKRFLMSGFASEIDSCQGSCPFLFRLSPQGSLVPVFEPGFDFDVDLLIYPNPSKGQFNYEIAERSDLLQEIAIYDVQGRNLLQFSRSDSQGSLDVSMLDHGIYYAVFRFKSGLEVVEKLILI